MTFDGGIIHATSHFEEPKRRYWERSREKLCPKCGETIEERATYCGPCNGVVQRWRRACKRRAEHTTHEEKVIMAQRQTIRLCDMAAMEVQ